MFIGFKNLLELIRFNQWIKNAFLFFPIIFSGQLLVWHSLSKVFLATIAFCLISSAMYIFNDLQDIHRDVNHPRKMRRLLPSGRITPIAASVVLFVLLISGISASVLLNHQFFFCVALYVALNIAYSLSLKNVVILDVIFIALGFEIRVWAGSVAFGIVPSVWLQLCVFILALLLGFSKRQMEIFSLKEKAGEHRKVLSEYSAYFLDQMILISASLTVVFYALYSISPDVHARIGNDNMLYTLIFVIFGVFRYLYLIFVKRVDMELGEILLTDRSMLFTVFLWIISIFLIFYFV